MPTTYKLTTGQELIRALEQQIEDTCKEAGLDAKGLYFAIAAGDHPAHHIAPGGFISLCRRRAHTPVWEGQDFGELQQFMNRYAAKERLKKAIKGMPRAEVIAALDEVCPEEAA